MKKKYIIVLIRLQEGELKDVQAWSTLTECCKANEHFSYGYIKTLKFPFTYKGYEFYKVRYNQK